MRSGRARPKPSLSRLAARFESSDAPPSATAQRGPHQCQTSADSRMTMIQRGVPPPIQLAHCMKAMKAGLLSPMRSERAREICQSAVRSEEHTSELQSLMRRTYAVFCLKKKTESQTLMTSLYTVF